MAGDDFVTMGMTGSPECEANLRSMEQVCMELGMPVEPTKTEGSATRITFLGTEFNSEAMEICLPQEKCGPAYQPGGQRSMERREICSL